MTQTRTLHAALCAVTGMALLGFIDNFVKIMATELGLWQFHFARSIFVLSLIVLTAVLLRWPMAAKNWKAVAFRSFFSASAMIFYFAAVAILPIAQVGAGLFTAPIFVLVISALFYGMRIGPARIGAVALGFLGVILLLKPEADAIGLISAMPVLAGALYGYGAVCTRVYCAEESTLTMVIGFFAVLGVWGALGLAWFALTGTQSDPAIDSFAATGWTPWTEGAVFWTLAQGIVSLLGLALITRAYLLAEASHVAVFEYAFLISAGAWAYILWGESPDTLGLLGIVLIIIAGLVIIMRTRDRTA